MKKYKPVFWPVPVFYRDELKPTKRGKRAASNYGLCIVARKGTPSYVIEQEKYESRYWVLHFWRLIDFYWFYGFWWDMANAPWWKHKSDNRMHKAAKHLCRVECASRAQEIRAKWKGHIEARGFIGWMEPSDIWVWSESGNYALSIHGAQNYPFFQAAGWSEEDVYRCILENL